MPRRMFKYHREWIKMAVEIEDAMSIVILNPRNIQARSLKEADLDFVADKNRYRQGRKYIEDRPKRDKAGLS